jgi:hypothetical protein
VSMTLTAYKIDYRGTEKIRNLKQKRILRIDKCKGEVVPVLNQAPHNEDVWGSGCIAPRVINLGARCR